MRQVPVALEQQQQDGVGPAAQSGPCTEPMNAIENSF